MGVLLEETSLLSLTENVVPDQLCCILQDLEEELDKKDRLIKKLQDQIKTLRKSVETGENFI